MGETHLGPRCSHPAVVLRHLSVAGFRNYREASLGFANRTTAILGDNGQGKSNILEAVAHLAGATLRGATTENMIGVGNDRAILRAEARRGERDLQVEVELVRSGRGRMQLNRQPIRRSGDLLEGLRVSIFAPDDLILVKGGPGERRRLIDDAAVALDPRTASVRSDVDRILRQRNALLRQVGGRLDEMTAATLDVWDERLARSGTKLQAARTHALAVLRPAVVSAYADVADLAQPVGMTLEPSTGADSLAEALDKARPSDVRRGLTTVGPHRDELALTVDGLPARTHASQGEQRSLALALRLAVHRAVTDRLGATPVLLLDDVFSELDQDRTTRLLASLPPGQTILTSATALPDGVRADRLIRVAGGAVVEDSGTDR